MNVFVAAGWAALLVAGWARHPVAGGLRVFPQGMGTWHGPTLAAAWSRHAGLLLAAGVWVGALAGWGAPLLSWTGRRAGPLRRPAALALGFGLLGFAVLGLGLTGLVFPVVLGLAAALPCVRLARGWRGRVRLPAVPPDAWTFALAVPILLALPGMLAPETSWDAMVYHLRLPATFVLEHRHFADAGSPFAGYPGLTELHYLLGLALTGSSDLAKLQHATCWGLTAWLLYEAAPVGRAARACAALAWLALPLGMQLAGMAYVDLATAWLTAVAAALSFRSEPRLAAACAGLALATKYTGGVALLGLAAVVPPRRWPAVAGWAAIPGGLWLARNWLTLGNPAYPFAAGWLGGVSSATIGFWHAHPPGSAAAGAAPGWRHPWTALVADDGGVGAGLSPLWLAAVAPAIGLRLTGGRWRFAAAGWAAWWLLRLDVRFLLPVVPAALLAVGSGWGERAVRVAAVVALVLGAPVSALTIAHASFTVFDTLPPALGLRSREDHLRNGLDPRPEFWNIAQELARRTPPRARLLYLAGIKNHYVERRCSTAHQHIDPVPLLSALRLAGTAERLAIRLRQAGYGYLVDLSRATTTAVQAPGGAPDEAQARVLVDWLRHSTEFAFRSGEAQVYALVSPRHPRRLGRVPLLESAVLERITAGAPGAGRAVTTLEALAPESSSAALARGLAGLLGAPPRLEEAKRALLAAVRHPEASALAWRALGWVLDRTGEPGRALAAYRQAVALNPSDGDARFGAGMVLAAAGRWAEAAAELDAAVRLDPGREDFRRALIAVTTRRP